VFDESLPPDADGAPADYAPYPPPDDAAPPTPTPTGRLPRGFAQGFYYFNTRSPDACASFYTQLAPLVDRYWQNQDWGALARAVASAGCRSDLSYYLLGVAAENLGMPHASAVYYNLAFQFADPNVPKLEFRCSDWQGGCRGVDVYQQSLAGRGRAGSQP